MFDDQISNPAAPPANLPTEPVDMFAGVDGQETVLPPVDSMPSLAPAMTTAVDAGVLKKKNEVPTSATANISDFSNQPLAGETGVVYNMKEPVLGKIILVVVLLLVLAGLAWAGYWFYLNFNKSSVNPDSSANTSMPITTSQPEVAAVEPLPIETNSAPVLSSTATPGIDMANDQILFGEPVDSDQDGLDDVREKELNTDPNKPDTDGDGLSDGDEVIIWHTDPLNTDTDGDSHSDGTEVHFGYNPLGLGKMFEIVSSTTP